MPLRIFSRSSPKTITSSQEKIDGTELGSKEISRPPLCPLSDSACNNFPAELISSANPACRNELLTPGSQGKLLSSTPHQDLEFFESQENFASISPERHLLPPTTGISNSKMKFGWKDTKLRVPGSQDTECTSTAALLRSSASSASSHDSLSGNHALDQRSLYATPVAPNIESDLGSTNGTLVSRSLKYSQSGSGNAPPASSNGGASVQPATCVAIVPTTKTPSLQAACPDISAQADFEIEEDPAFWKDHNVQVVIRLRPLNSSEIATQGQSRCIRQDSAHALTWTGHPESRFTFDLVACESISQDKMFKVAGLPMVDNCMAGYNSCMFAYGQTGSGKTHTMLGDLEDADQRSSDNRGMTPRVFEYLFARIQKEEEARSHERLQFVCRCSFLEIYNEQILDLLEPMNTNLQMREDAKKGVYVENLLEVEVKNVHDVIRLLLQGAAYRKVASTNMNRESSRSHSVFTCIIESKLTSQSLTSTRCGRLHLVDLAGSERQKSSGAEGERLKEAANINKSLSTLGLVIMSLVDIASGKQRHVPYRDSKLTFLLHDSLGGNSKTTIIANISPSNCCAMETLSTLKFAQRAKFIRNIATINESTSGDVMALRLQIQQLKQEVNRLRLQSMGSNMLQGTLDSFQDGMVGNDNNCLELFNINNIGHSAYSLEAWDSLKALASPTFSSKKKKELEVAFVGSLRREQVGETRIRQLYAEIEQFKRLVKQREEDSQCGKMMLRFREDKIKRLESVLGGLISGDFYLLEEKNNLLEEVQILRARLERNPEVTRFAMENIRLLEELRRFQDFYEAGERDMMSEEISILRDQLWEALDWKLMHEQDPQRNQGADLVALSEENEILQMKVERFHREVDALRNNLSSCLEAKEKLERRVDDMQMQIDIAKSSYVCSMKENDEDSCIPSTEGNDFVAVRLRLEKQIETVEAVASMQAELIAMREAVGAATEGELEARGRVSLLTGEIEGLQNGLKELQQENARLCGMFESALSEKDAIIQELNSKKNTRCEEKDAAEVAAAAENEVKVYKFTTEKDAMINKVHKTKNFVLGPKDATVGTEGVAADELDVQSGIVAFTREIESLKKNLKELQEENARLCDVYNSALSEKDAMMNEVNTKKKIGCEGNVSNRTFRDTIAAATVEELKAQERVSLLAGEVEGLQKGLKELQEENSRLCGMYESALSEKDVVIKELKAVKNFALEEGNVLVGMKEALGVAAVDELKALDQVSALTREIECLQKVLKDLQEENTSICGMSKSFPSEKDALKPSTNQSPGAKENSEGRGCEHAHHLTMEVKSLQEGLKMLKMEYARLCQLYEQDLTEKKETLDALRRDREVVCKETELQKLESVLETTRQVLEECKTKGDWDLCSLAMASQVNCKDYVKNKPENNSAVEICQDLSFSEGDGISCFLQEHCVSLQNMEDKAIAMMQQVEGQIEKLEIILGSIDAAVKVFGNRNESLEALVHSIDGDISLLVSIMDEKDLGLQTLGSNLEHTDLKLRDAEQARDEAMRLSSLQKGNWAEDRNKFQHEVESAFELLSCQDEFLATQSKLNLLESNLAKVSGVVSACNLRERKMELIANTNGEIREAQTELTVVEESLPSVQLKLTQAENKLSALKIVLVGFSAAKEAWMSREERMRKHLEMLSCVSADKEMEVAGLQTEKEYLQACVDQLLKHEELMMLEAATLKEKLYSAEELRMKDAESITGFTGMGHTSLSMMQLLRGEEEKVTLISVLENVRQNLKRIRADIEQGKSQIGKIDTALLCAQVDLEASIASVHEAELEINEIRKERKVLQETEADTRSALNMLVIDREHIESEVRQLEEKVKVLGSYLQRQKTKVSQGGHHESGELLTTDDSEEITPLENML